MNWNRFHTPCVPVSQAAWENVEGCVFSPAHALLSSFGVSLRISHFQGAPVALLGLAQEEQHREALLSGEVLLQPSHPHLQLGC